MAKSPTDTDPRRNRLIRKHVQACRGSYEVRGILFGDYVLRGVQILVYVNDERDFQ
jgi:hypothetical protein